MQPNKDPYSTFQPSLSTDSKGSDESAQDEETKAIALHVENASKGFLAAFNSHDFDPASEIYRFKSPHFVAEGGYLFPDDLNLKDYLIGWEGLAATFPEMHCKLLDWTTYVDIKSNYAEMFCNMEITGRPPGLIRKSVAILEYKYHGKKGEKGEWLCTRFKGIRGADSAAPGGVEADKGMGMGPGMGGFI